MNRLEFVLSAKAQELRQELSRASGYVRNFSNQSRADLQKAATSVRGFATQAANDVGRAYKKNREELQQTARAALVVGAALTASLGLAANATLNFDKQMSVLRGVAGANVREFKDLREATLAAGKATTFSATEAAEGATELARAGVSVTDIINGGLVGALNLAAAGQISLAEAAEVAASAMTVFRLRGTDVGHIGDVLAAAANKAQGGVHDMSLALKQSALVASNFNLNLEDTVGTLALFASRGLIGSDAGTSFKTMLQRLVPQSKEAASMMKQLGIDFFDAQGRFIGIRGAAEQLRQGLKGVSEETRISALNTIFGQDAIRAATILYEAGAKGVDDWATAVNDAGSASRLAKENMNNLSGDLERLKGSFETALIKTGDQSNGVLRRMVQTADALVGAYADLPGGVQAAAGGFMALTSAVLLAVGAAGVLIPKYQALKAALIAMGTTGQRVAQALYVTSIAMAAVAAAAVIGLGIYAVYTARKAEAKRVTDEFTQALLQERNGQEGSASAAVSKQLADRKLFGTISSLGVAQQDYNDALRGNEQAQSRVADAILRNVPSLERNERAHIGLAKAIGGSSESWVVFKRVYGGSFRDTNVSLESVERLAKAAQKLRPAYTDAERAANDQAKAQKEVGTEARDTAAALGLSGGQAEKFAQSVSGEADDLSKLAAQIGLTRDQLVGFGADNEEAAAEIGKKVKDAAEATDKGFASLTDIVSHFGKETSVTSAQVRSFYADVVKKSEKFTADINTAMQRGLDPGLISRLLQAGPEAAAPVLQAMLSDHSGRLINMVNESEQKLNQVTNLAIQMTRITTLAANAANDEMASHAQIAMKIVEQKWKAGGTNSAKAIADQLGIGVQQVIDIAKEYGIGITAAANQVQAAFGAAPIDVSGIDRAAAERGRYVKRAEGGFLPAQATIAPPRTLVQWAEPETGGEAFIPLAPWKRPRSKEILKTVAHHFDLTVVDPRNGGHKFASGGIFGAFPPPNIRGAGDYGRSGQAVMDHEWEMLKAIQEASKTIGTGWQSITDFLSKQGVPFTVSSSTGGQHAPGSLHYVGKAVDLVGNLAAIFRALEPLASRNKLQELFYDPLGAYDNGRRIPAIGGHPDHVHAATYDRGGYLMPGLNIALNKTGRPEPVFNDRKLDALIDAIDSKGGGGVTIEKVVIEDRKDAGANMREMRRKLG